nr:putative ribonuclease h protein [Quercus suber]
MKMIAWNCQGVGNEMFRSHAYKLHRRHRLNILIIIKPRIVEARAQAVIDTLPYSHSQRVDPAGFSGGIWLLWNECSSCIVEIITCSDHSIHALVKLISVNKSRTWLSPCTPRHLKEQVAGILGLPTTDHIGTYLETPIFTTRCTASSYQYPMDNIRKRIEGWQTKYLSMPGWATLVKASATSIPIYAMQTILLPQNICHRIDQLCSNFLWEIPSITRAATQ